MRGRSLAETSPELAAEWDVERNAPLLPEHVAGQSHKKAWWTCRNDPLHQWQAAPHNRFKNPKCPYCAGTIASEETSLAARRPDLCLEWHPTRNGDVRPENLLPGTHRALWWKCTSGHEWKAAVYSRVAGNGCPYCANRIVHGPNSLATLHPEIARDWYQPGNGRHTPHDTYAASSRNIWWQCRRNPTHIWRATVTQRTRIGTGCPLCQSSTSVPELRVFAEIRVNRPGNLGGSVV